MKIRRSVPGLTVYSPVSQMGVSGVRSRSGMMGGLGDTAPATAPSDGIVGALSNIVAQAETFISQNPRTVLGVIGFLLLK